MEDKIYKVWLAGDGMEEKEFDIVGTFADGEKEYIALQESDEESKREVYFARIFPGEDDELLIEPIESDEEYESASEIFESLFNENNTQDEYILDDVLNLPDEPYNWQEKDDSCYMDEEGRMFLLDEFGNPVFLDEDGRIIPDGNIPPQ